MKNRRWIKRLWIALPVLLALLLLVTVREQRAKYCSGISVVLENTDKGSFLTEEDLIRLIYEKHDSLPGQRVHDIDITAIERGLKTLPYVAEADVYFTLHGILKVRIVQRNVIARVFDKHGHSVYLSHDGVIMPVMPDFRQRVIVVSGNISDSLRAITGRNIRETDEGSVLAEIYKVACYIHNDLLYDALITQVYVNESKELELIPSIDDHVILIGNADSLEYKFSKLMAFYTRGMTRTGWDIYDQINLKYSNQVICRDKSKTN